MKKYLGIIFAILIFTFIWHFASVLVSRPFLPAPGTVVASLLRLAAAGKLWRHVWASLNRVIWAVVFSGIPAIILGLAAGRSARVNFVISPLIYLLHPLPKAAFLPIIMLFFGIGEAAKIFLVAFIVFGQMLVTVRDAAKQIAAEYLDIVRSMGAGFFSIFGHVIIPALLPGIFTALRISLGTAIAVLFIAETFVSESGLGYLIIDAWLRLAYADMYAAILVMSVMGLFLFVLTDLFEFILCPWRRVNS